MKLNKGYFPKLVTRMLWSWISTFPELLKSARGLLATEIFCHILVCCEQYPKLYFLNCLENYFLLLNFLKKYFYIYKCSTWRPRID